MRDLAGFEADQTAAMTEMADLERAATPTSTPLSRRGFMAATGGLVAAPGVLWGGRGEAGARGGDLFTLGVMSGDPSATSVVLWTRLAPDPLNGGGMPRRPVLVEARVALDSRMRHVVRRGVFWALPHNGHSVHVLATRLRPNQTYYYRFYARGQASTVGRTQTFPATWQDARRMRFVFTSCQSYVQGSYAAWRDIAGLADHPETDINFVCQLGDYMYEGAGSGVIEGRDHPGEETFSIESYRNRYALYRLDQDLQRAQSLYPFIVTPDDHEVDNNYAGEIPEETSDDSQDEFLVRRRNAYKVYAETMPLRRRRLRGPDRDRLILYRRLHFGALANIHVFDTRQFRSDQAAGDNFGSPDALAAPEGTPLCDSISGALLQDCDTFFDPEGILDEDATLLGASQERWLHRGLARSRARWNVLAQQIMTMPWNIRETTIQLVAQGLIPGIVEQLVAGGASLETAQAQAPGLADQSSRQVFGQVNSIIGVDAWDGYPAARQRLFDTLRATNAANPVVLTGDIHSSWAADLLEDPSDATSRSVATEFVCSSISSTFLSQNPVATDLGVRAGNAVDNANTVRHFNAMFRGYCLCDVDQERWRTTYRSVLPTSYGSAPISALGLAGLFGANVLADGESLGMTSLNRDSAVFDDAVFEVKATGEGPDAERRVQRKADLTGEAVGLLLSQL